MNDTVLITSSTPLNEKEEREALFKAGQLFGNVSSFKFLVDPTILGGLIFKSADKILDLSTLNKINRMKEYLKSK